MITERKWIARSRRPWMRRGRLDAADRKSEAEIERQDSARAELVQRMRERLARPHTAAPATTP
ncbi:hypothetical protein [Streptomyces erythrochromogenes]|uniref:hypothetical protein n=1 Tax=Streptomyces erythrochromogenes TaxID=285574 RepID=UPI0002EA81E4